MFNKKYIAGIASFAGTAINNVKAAENSNGAFTIVIDNKEYSLEAKKIADVTSINDIDKLLSALETAKVNIKDNDSNPFLKAITKELYFVKSIQPVGNSTNDEFKIGGNFVIKLTAAKAAKIELVSKRKCINFKYTGAKQLKKAAEDELLGKILQGKTLDNVKITGLTKDGGNKLGEIELEENSKVVGNDIKLFESTPCELTINSDKIGNGIFKTVVCKFAEGVEEKLVKDLDLEKLCVKGSDLNAKGLAEVFTALNGIELTSENIKVFFNPSVKSKIKCNGTQELDDSTKKTDSNDGNFIFIENIAETDINPIFLKKNFSVEFDDENDNTKKVAPDILDKIIEALNAKFSDTVTIRVSDITKEISGVKNSTDNDIIAANAFDSLNAISIDGVNKTGSNLVSTDVVNSKDITVKLKSAVFAKDIVKTEIKLTCDLTNVKKGDKVLKGDVKGIISPILNKTLTEVIAIKDIIGALNTALDGKLADENKKIEATDFDFSTVSSDNTNINKSGSIVINESFAGKLNNDCFETEKEQNETNKTGEASKGTNGDSGSGDGNKDQKGYCGSNKK